MTPPNKIPFPQFDIQDVNRLIQHRRSVFTRGYSDQPVDRADVEQILANAHWAPTHGRTEPWHFVVISGSAREAFGKAHAKMYKRHTPEADFKEAKYQKLARRPTECSHLIAVCMKRGNNPRIPVLEETNSVACAVQNMYLTTLALGLVGYWTTGGMTYHPAMKAHFGLGEEDQFMGFFMLAKPKDSEFYPKGLRKEGWEEKVEWWE